MAPAITQTTRDIPVLPTCWIICPGEAKIPLPTCEARRSAWGHQTIILIVGVWGGGQKQGE